MHIRRDDDDVFLYDTSGYRSYDPWTDDVGFIVKWSILTAIVVGIFAYFVGGYFHARMRLKKGLPLLGYHRWLIPRSRRPDLVMVTYHANQYGQIVAPSGQVVGYSEQLPKYEPNEPPSYTPSADAQTQPSHTGPVPSIVVNQPPPQPPSNPPPETR